jgi:hypothetical protein
MQARLAAMQARQRPENEVPVSLALDAVLLEGPDAAVVLGGVQAFSTGVGFTVTAVARRAEPSEGLFGSLHGHRGDGLLLGVEYADGRTASTVPRRSAGPAVPGRVGGDAGAEDPMLQHGSGSGSLRHAESTYYLSPLPPPGVLGLAETTTELSADEIRRAAAGARTLWAWEPEPDYPVPAPEIPPGGWFDAQTGPASG